MLGVFSKMTSQCKWIIHNGIAFQYRHMVCDCSLFPDILLRITNKVYKMHTYATKLYFGKMILSDIQLGLYNA